ncbi:PREDICTED: collagen alpha-2(IV) chain-like [Corvus brachyrhynchos]|uniref:collagen alpha-2(IV) chain-like n=1 Tax=Corvus brachyrhynchos TaxID=85066 RepID=UPI00081638FD|nr:PREDICTED: collagen alpha-2(IV) chain-like [Corvus brachyrhynchos]
MLLPIPEILGIQGHPGVPVAPWLLPHSQFFPVFPSFSRRSGRCRVLYSRFFLFSRFFPRKVRALPFIPDFPIKLFPFPRKSQVFFQGFGCGVRAGGGGEGGGGGKPPNSLLSWGIPEVFQEFLALSTFSQGFLGFPELIQEFLRLSRDSQSYPGIPGIFQGFLSFSRCSWGYPGIPEVFQDFLSLSWNSRAFPGLPKVLQEFLRLSWNSRAFPGLPKVLQEFPSFSSSVPFPAPSPPSLPEDDSPPSPGGPSGASFGVTPKPIPGPFGALGTGSMPRICHVLGCDPGAPSSPPFPALSRLVASAGGAVAPGQRVERGQAPGPLMTAAAPGAAGAVGGRPNGPGLVWARGPPARGIWRQLVPVPSADWSQCLRVTGPSAWG